jgi:hypothetical protein
MTSSRAITAADSTASVQPSAPSAREALEVETFHAHAEQVRVIHTDWNLEHLSFVGLHGSNFCGQPDRGGSNDICGGKAVPDRTD